MPEKEVKNNMKPLEFTVRWDEVDLNGHLRHTGYGAMCAEARVRAFAEAGMGITRDSIAEAAPVLLREELSYRREVMLGETVSVTTEISPETTAEGKRWVVVHQVLKADGELACEVKVMGTWINLETRKSVPAPQSVLKAWGLDD